MTANSWQWMQTVFLAMWSIAVVWALNESAYLVIVPTQQKQTVSVNQNYFMGCALRRETREFSLRWINPRGEEVKNGTRMIVLEDWGVSLVLQFLKPTVDDSGVYKCEAIYRNSVVKKSEVELIFYNNTNINWEGCEKDQSLVLGKRGERIKCRVTDSLSLVEWKKDGKPLNNSRYVFENDTIAVKGEVSEVDAGLYKVLVEDIESVQFGEIVVNVHIVPKIVEASYALEEREMSLHCKASGRPDPMYSWLDHLGRNLSNVSDYIVDRKNGDLTTLVVNEGQFICVAENAAGRDEKEMHFFAKIPKLVSYITNDTKIVPDGSQDTKQGQSKREILAKACEYITELVSENSRLQDLVKDLESRSNELDTARQQLIDQKSEIRSLQFLLQRLGVPVEST